MIKFYIKFIQGHSYILFVNGILVKMILIVTLTKTIFFLCFYDFFGTLASNYVFTFLILLINALF